MAQNTPDRFQKFQKFQKFQEIKTDLIGKFKEYPKDESKFRFFSRDLVISDETQTLREIFENYIKCKFFSPNDVSVLKLVFDNAQLIDYSKLLDELDK